VYKCSPQQLVLYGRIWSIAYRGIKHSDFCCFIGVTYVALTLCFKLRSFSIDIFKERNGCVFEVFKSSRETWWCFILLWRSVVYLLRAKY